MKKYGVKGQLSDTPQLGESVVVLAWEAEAAIAAVEAKAHQFVAALVHSQGGEVVITFHDLLSVDRNPVLERFDNPDGSITLRALQEKP